MTETNRYRIVVALDLSEYAEIVLEHALDQAVRHEAPDVHFVTVVDPGKPVAEAKERLADLVLQGLDVFHKLGSDWRARLHVREGRADEEIVNLAAEIRAHLIVVGRFGGHGRRAKLGNVAKKLLEAATCPTLFVTLVDQAVERDVCAACSAVRAESDGERWFCAAHVGDRLVSSNLTTTWTGGTLMW